MHVGLANKVRKENSYERDLLIRYRILNRRAGLPRLPTFCGKAFFNHYTLGEMDQDHAGPFLLFTGKKINLIPHTMQEFVIFGINIVNSILS